MKILSKRIIIIAALVAMAMPLMGIGGQVHAASCRESLLGLVPWDCNSNIENVSGQDELTAAIIVIATNILTDITMLGSYLALGYLIYGGYQYMFSGGDPTKAATGKKTLTQAFIGLAIVMLSTVIFSGIRIALSANHVSGSSVGLPQVDIDMMLANLIGWVIGISGVVAAIFLVYGGISYMTAAGDAGKLTKAKNSIKYALIGLAIVGLSQVILAFVRSNLEKAKDNATSIIYELNEGEKIC